MEGRPQSDAEGELVAEAVFYALFRVVEIEELSGSEDAVGWARGLVDDPEMRRAFGDGVIKAVAERESGGAGSSGR